MCAVVLAPYETLLPLFDRDERRAILYLQHAMGPALQRTYDLMSSTLNERKDPPIRSKRRAPRRSGSTPPTSSLTSSDRIQGFEMNIRRCFFATSSTATMPGSSRLSCVRST